MFVQPHLLNAKASSPEALTAQEQNHIVDQLELYAGKLHTYALLIILTLLQLVVNHKGRWLVVPRRLLVSRS